MRLEQLAYKLRPENIASEPIEVRLGERDLGRMLLVNRAEGSISHAAVRDLPGLLSPGDVLVLNDSKRIPGVIRARTPIGAQIEFRLVDFKEDRTCIARPFPDHFVTRGLSITTEGGSKAGVIRSGIGKHGLCEIKFDDVITDVLKREGLPITSFFYKGYWDLQNYNPVYAKNEGSVESPMAGLHFTERLLDELREAGIKVCFVTLHVVGSWLPYFGKTTASYEVQSEGCHVPAETAQAIKKARKAGKRVVAVGTTTVRTLESAAKKDRTVKAGTRQSKLFITPGFKFSVVDTYFTNFHPSGSTLMALDAAFCPKSLLLKAYAEAKNAGYLFYEFGDAILFV